MARVYWHREGPRTNKNEIKERKKNETSKPESNLKRNQRKDKITIRKMLHTHSRRQKMKRLAHCAEATRLSAFRTNNNTIKTLDFQFGLYFSHLFSHFSHLWLTVDVSSRWNFCISILK